MFTKPVYHAWLKSRDTAVVVVVVGEKSRPRAIPPAMLTMKKETLGFHNFYAWFSSVSSIFIGMGVRSPEKAGEVPLKT